MTEDYFRLYPTDVEFHARVANSIDANPFDKNDSRYFEWVKAYNNSHKIICENKKDCCG